MKIKFGSDGYHHIADVIYEHDQKPSTRYFLSRIPFKRGGDEVFSWRVQNSEFIAILAELEAIELAWAAYLAKLVVD